MANQLKGGAIGKWFGGRMTVCQVKDDGTNLAVPDTWKDLSYQAEITVKMGGEMEEVPNEAGKVIDAIPDIDHNTIEGIFHQSDKDLLDFLSNDCKNKYYRVYIDLGINNGNYQEFFAARCKIQPTIELKSGTRKPPFKIFILDNAAEITIDKDSDLPTIGATKICHTAADVVVPINRGFLIVETAIV